MSFHLEGPWLNTTGKKRGPKKWTSSEAKKKAKMLGETWQELKQELGVKEETERRRQAKMTGTLTVKMARPPGRETAPVPSQDTGWVTCAKAADKEYTGDKCLGISVLHKSNGIPVFSQEEVISISKMRR
jgi:hypothetical protein